MGLDCSHDAWEGSYSAFTRWRHKIAEVAGYAIWPVKDDNRLTMDTIIIDWGHVPAGAVMGEWENTPDDPLIVLFTHSDCDGVIHPAQGGPLADRLEEILPEVEGDGGGHIGSYREKTKAFIEGLREAAIAGEPLEFY